jgi:hypothetical protein
LVLGVSLELGAWDLELFQTFLGARALFPGSMRDNPQHCLTIAA